ncbi:MAG: hypothetical protein ABI650_06140 [Dokdonella sp.]
MKNTVLVAALAAVLGLTACNQQDSAANAQRDVEQARQKAAEDVKKVEQSSREDAAEAQRKLDAARAEARSEVATADANANEKINDATSEAMDTAREAGKDVANVEANTIETQAKAAYDVDIAKADADLKIAKERCETLPSGQSGPCKDQADSGYDAAKASAKRALDDANTAAADAKR